MLPCLPASEQLAAAASSNPAAAASGNPPRPYSRNGDLILHDNDIDLSVLNPEWVSLEAGLRKLLPKYSVAVVVPSEDPTTQFMRVYCPLGMCDLFGALDM